MPAVVIVLATLVATSRQDDRYEVYADVLVSRQEAATTSLIGQTPVLDDPYRTMETQARLARVGVVVDRTLEAAGAGGASTDAFLRNSSVFPLEDFLRFIVYDRDRGRAARLVNAHANEFVRYRRELDTAGFASTLRELRAQMAQLETAGEVGSPLYVRLADREQQLELLTALRSSNVSVVQTATPGDAEKVSPRPRKNAALALGAGLVLGLILVFLAESLSTKPRTDDELEALLGMRLLGRLEDRKPDGPVRLDGADGPGADAVHSLRSNLELVNRTVGARMIMVTSAYAGEGKSVVAADVAVALARSGRRVVLVDLDVRRRALTQLFGLDERFGVPALVRGQCKLERALVAVQLGDGLEPSGGAESNGRVGSGARLELVGAGPVEVHPAELLSSRALGEALAELGERADVVLVDVPPLLEAPDAAAVAPHLDGLLLVVSSRGARGPILADVRRAVETWPLAKLGFAVTDGWDERGAARHVRFPGRPTSVQAPKPEQVA